MLFDIGNTHTHVGLADGRRVVKQADIPTLPGRRRRGGAGEKIVGNEKIDGAVLCSVVPRATPLVAKSVRALGNWTRWN